MGQLCAVIEQARHARHEGAPEQRPSGGQRVCDQPLDRCLGRPRGAATGSRPGRLRQAVRMALSTSTTVPFGSWPRARPLPLTSEPRTRRGRTPGAVRRTARCSLSGAERSRPITFASINVSSRKASANRPPKASSSGGRVYGRLFSSRTLGSSPSRSMCSHYGASYAESDERDRRSL